MGGQGAVWGGRGPLSGPEPRAPANIDCIDCGGRCHLLTRLDPQEPPQPGDMLTYRCEDCLDRWDLLIPEDPA